MTQNSRIAFSVSWTELKVTWPMVMYDSADGEARSSLLIFGSKKQCAYKWNRWRTKCGSVSSLMNAPFSLQSKDSAFPYS